MSINSEHNIKNAPIITSIEVECSPVFGSVSCLGEEGAYLVSAPNSFLF